ncbi:TolC family protein [Candidatus Dependentiae bacterium]
MRIRIFYIISLILIIPHCTKKNSKKPFESVQDQSKKRFNVEPTWKCQTIKSHVNDLLDNGISLNNAIAIGINNNLSLQAKFEEIGISKSDLLQAGFYTNPNLQAIFRIPKTNDLKTNAEITANFILSDLWQVPLRKKIAQHDLEVKTYEIVHEILHLRYDIQKRYITCLYNQKHLHLVKEITKVINSLKKRIDYRHTFGYTNDLDKYFAESKLGEWQIKIMENKTILRTSYIDLYEILGGNISTKPVELFDTLHTFTISTPLHELENFALSCHPSILIEKAKIARANKTISYEKSRIIDNMQIGIAYEQDFERKASGVGPSLSLDIPLFNTNYGNIERAKFALREAEKTLAARKQTILKNMMKSYLNYKCHLEQIDYYKKSVIPPITKAIAFSKKFFDRMQINMIVFLETQIDLYQHKAHLLELVYKTALEYAALELSIGSQLKNIN